MAAGLRIMPGAWFADGAGNVWQVSAGGHPVVNGIIDTVSRCAWLELWDGVEVWQCDQTNEWYMIAPTEKITSAAQISWDGPLEAPSEKPEQPPIDPPPSGGGGTGPAASGWLTADFEAPHMWYGTDTQQLVDALTYGCSSGGAGDGRFASFGNSAYTTEIAKVQMGFWSFIANISSGNSYFRADGSVDEAVFNTLLNNWHKVDPAGKSGWMFGLEYPMQGVTDPTSYGRCAGNLARFLLQRGLPLIGITGPDEPDSRPMDQLAAYVNALVSAIQQVDPKLVTMGPCTSWADGGKMRDFMNRCPGVDWASWNMYPGGTDLGEQAWLNPQYANRAAGDIKNMRDNAPRKLAGYCIGGFNMDWNCSAQSQHNYCGAVWAVLVLIDTLNGANAPVRACIWDAARDGTCGFVPDPNNWATQGCAEKLTPFGYAWARLAAQAVGGRCKVTGGVNGLRTLAIKHDDGGCSLTILNAGQGNQMAKNIALSHWPYSSDGDGEVEVWQMKNNCHGVGQDGSCVKASVEAGVVQVDLPDPSVTVISI